nr:reverse transcriptase domain-containing protein [Tanacetum cinerariifolium]
MSSDITLSAVTYTSISFESDRPSWGISLMDAGELPKMDPYKEVAQQGQAQPLLPAYVPSPMELDEHVPYANNASPIAKSPGHIADSELEPPMSASMEARIVEHAATPIPPTSPAYDQVPLGCDVAESSAAAARPPRGQYDFVDTTDRRDIRLEIDVVRGKRTAYEIELHEVRQAYLSSEARNRALLARLKTLETHMSRMEWQLQSAKDLAVRQMIRIHALEAKAQIDTMEDTGSSCVVGLSQWLKKMESVFHISGCTIDNQVKFTTCTLLGDALTWWNGHGTLKKKPTDKYYPKGKIKKLEIELWNVKVKGNDVAAYTQRFQELALMCTKFLADETEKIDKYIGGLPDNIHENVMYARPKTLNDAIEFANDLMDQKQRTYAERQNENKRKADDSSRNNQQQQPYKKQNVARAYTAGPGETRIGARLCWGVMGVSEDGERG